MEDADERARNSTLKTYTKHPRGCIVLRAKRGSFPVDRQRGFSVLVELLKGVALGLAVGMAIGFPIIVAAFFYKRSQRRKRAQ
ncbi:hypothetical protein GCM10010341_80170 [Streptomyces noursei]|nr:hypothetical protein GCM10010341_80170 [Streptomyces noursei]